VVAVTEALKLTTALFLSPSSKNVKCSRLAKGVFFGTKYEMGLSGLFIVSMLWTCGTGIKHNTVSGLVVKEWINGLKTVAFVHSLLQLTSGVFIALSMHSFYWLVMDRSMSPCVDMG